jgi:RNA polymerase sigma-70 factor (TIGR02960 family)
MTRTTVNPSNNRSGVLTGLITDSIFSDLFDRHRRELHVHCYRMLASYDQAEDAVQDAFLRAWRSRETFDGDHPRAWLYRIATNVCLDMTRRSGRQVPTVNSIAEIPWLQPYPDRLLNEAAPPDAEPEAVAVARETIELAYLAVIQLLPARQRAVLLLRDVQGWPAVETAQMLDMSVAAANSALQRARATLREQLPERSADWASTEPTLEERDLLAKFIDTHQREDAHGAIALMREDIRITMPPHPWCFNGIAEVGPMLVAAFGPDRPGDWRLLPTMANRMPTAASYLRAPSHAEFRAFKFDVIRVAGGKVAEVTTFGPELFPAFGLPLTLDDSPAPSPTRLAMD